MALIFVTGSDTGVGKTHVAGLLARRLSRDGFTQVIKPVESGAGAGRPADADKAAGDWAEAHTLVSLPRPIAPLAAAKQARKKVDLTTLLKLYRALPAAPAPTFAPLNLVPLTGNKPAPAPAAVPAAPDKK